MNIIFQSRYITLLLSLILINQDRKFKFWKWNGFYIHSLYSYKNWWTRSKYLYINVFICVWFVIGNMKEREYCIYFLILWSALIHSIQLIGMVKDVLPLGPLWNIEKVKPQQLIVSFFFFLVYCLFYFLIPIILFY